jgi:hypothetical protein
MIITEKTVFVINGKSFDSQEKAMAYEADMVGEFIQENLLKGITFGPRDRLKLLANILDNRAQLCAILE